MTKKPYLVTIEEISRRTVIVWADDSNGEGIVEAEMIADELAGGGIINLDFEDFQSRSCEAKEVDDETKLTYYESYDENGKRQRTS